MQKKYTLFKEARKGYTDGRRPSCCSYVLEQNSAGEQEFVYSDVQKYHLDVYFNSIDYGRRLAITKDVFLIPKSDKLFPNFQDHCAACVLHELSTGFH